MVKSVWLQRSKLSKVWNGGNVQNDVFSISIYEFNIYLFFKKGGGSYWRGALVRRNMVLQFTMSSKVISMQSLFVKPAYVSSQWIWSNLNTLCLSIKPAYFKFTMNLECSQCIVCLHNESRVISTHCLSIKSAYFNSKWIWSDLNISCLSIKPAHFNSQWIWRDLNSVSLYKT